MRLNQNIIKVRGVLFLTLLLLILISANSFAYVNWNIKVDGRVTYENKRLSGAVVTLMQNSRKIQEIITPLSGKFIFVLKPGNEYLIEVSKPGFVQKILSFSTKNIPDEVVADGFPTFPVEISLFEDIEGLNTSILDYPVGRIAYSLVYDEFGIDRNYARSIEADLQALYKQLRLLRRELAKMQNRGDGQSVAIIEESDLSDSEFGNFKLNTSSADQIDFENYNYTKKALVLVTSIHLLEAQKEKLKNELKETETQVISYKSFTENNYQVDVKTLSIGSKIVEYKKIIQPWGAVFYFKDGASITKHIYLLETGNKDLVVINAVKF